METQEAQLLKNSLISNNYTIREETLDGVLHLVVPVVMMKEGVHSGSHGPIFHTEAELQRFTAAWNGIPIMIQHPQIEGENVAANQPGVIETNVGRVFHTTYSDGLRAEAWIDIEKITNASPEALAYIRQMRPLDVSVGVFTDEERTTGTYNNTTYEVIARNYRPDHLALLPGATGACSWAAGCGIRSNKEGGKMDDLLMQSFKDLSKKGYAVSLINNEQGFREIGSKIQTALDALDGNGMYHYLEEVFENDFVYYISRSDSPSISYYRRGYSMQDNGNVVLADNPVEVRKSVEYMTFAMRRTKKKDNSVETNKKEEEMSEHCCEGKIDNLIANEDTIWKAPHKEFLMTQEEGFIDALVEKKEVPQSNEGLKETAEAAVTAYKQTLTTMEDFTALMPADLKAQFEEGVKLHEERKTVLIKGILDNSGDTWKEEDLKAMEMGILERLAKTANVKDYSVQNAGGDLEEDIQSNEEPVLMPAGKKEKVKSE